MNFEQARHNMIEQQIRPWEVLDPRILAVLAKVRREDFVPARYRKLAFSDVNIPLDHQQVMMKPMVEGRMLQALELTPEDEVLEIGTGSGFITACLAEIAARVTSLEIFQDLSRQAAERLSAYPRVELQAADALADEAIQGRYGVIVVTGSLPEVDPRLNQALKTGGRMFMVVGSGPIMEAILITRVARDQWARESLFDTELPRLVNAREPKDFVF